MKFKFPLYSNDALQAEVDKHRVDWGIRVAGRPTKDLLGRKRKGPAKAPPVLMPTELPVIVGRAPTNNTACTVMQANLIAE